MTFLDECIEFAGPAWERYIHHPWIEALFAGTLQEDKFRYWLIQDLPYIGENASEVAFTKVPTHNPWVKLQREYGVRAAESRVELRILEDYDEFALTRWAARPRREAFVNFFVRAFYEGTFGDVCCAVYPCYCFHNTFGVRYENEKPKNLSQLQRDWLEQWQDPFYRDLQNATVDGINEYGNASTEFERDKMRWLFLRATQHQIATFDAAWIMSDPWPGEGNEIGILAGTAN